MSNLYRQKICPLRPKDAQRMQDGNVRGLKLLRRTRGTPEPGMKRSRTTIRPASNRRPRRTTPSVLDVLTADEAQIVLRRMLSARPDLISEAEHLASALLTLASATDIAARVSQAVLRLDWDDVNVGPQPGGYVEPAEAAWEAIQRALKPHLEDLQRRLRLKREEEALEVCKGIVAGLYRAEQNKTEFMHHAEDAPSEYAAQAVEMWRRRNRRREFPITFAKRFAPDWDWLIR